MQSYDSKDKETKEENEDPIEEQRGDISDSTTPSTLVKNKKRVHYPHLNGEDQVRNTEKTDSLATSGKKMNGLFGRKTKGIFLSRSVFQKPKWRF